MMARRNLAYMIMLFALPVSVHAQNEKSDQIIVSGRVIDENSDPIKGAFIYLDSAVTASSTNRKGFYTVKKKGDFKNISVFVPKRGMMTKVYAGETEVNFVIPKDLPKLTKKDLVAMGYKVQHGKADRYRDYATIYDLIRAEFSGVTVSGTQIKIRGSAVLTGGNARPLFVVDGNYVDDIGFVNPVELKSIEILKDEEAALYGARGGNGVVLIELSN